MGTWEAMSRFGIVPTYILPAPSAVVLRLVQSGHLLVTHTLVTALEILLGFLLAVAGGVLFAVAVVYVRPFERAVYPWLVASQAIPKVAIGPLFVLWLGFGLTPKVVIAFLIAWWMRDFTGRGLLFALGWALAAAGFRGGLDDSNCY